MEHRKNNHKLASVFVDSDAFIASLKEEDTNHSRAREIFDKLSDQPIHFVTSNFVFAEVVTVLSQRVNRQAAVNYIQTMTDEETPFAILRADETVEREAITVFLRQTSKNTSFVDCTNIAFMQLYRLDTIFTFDEIYRKNDIKMLTETSK